MSLEVNLRLSSPSIQWICIIIFMRLCELLESLFMLSLMSLLSLISLFMLSLILQQFQQQKISFAGLKLQHPSIRSLSHKAEKLA